MRNCIRGTAFRKCENHCSRTSLESPSDTNQLRGSSCLCFYNEASVSDHYNPIPAAQGLPLTKCSSADLRSTELQIPDNAVGEIQTPSAANSRETVTAACPSYKELSTKF